LESEDEIFSAGGSVRFPDRFSEIRVRIRPASIEFLSPGTYLFTLLVDGELIASRRVQVLSAETHS
jgi:hypothetical protein